MPGVRDQGGNAGAARCKVSRLQLRARNAARSSSCLGHVQYPSLLLWMLALSEAPEALGKVDPERADPDYAVARYSQPCKSVWECGARQSCVSGRCACPYNLGLTGGPQCTTTSQAAWVLLTWVLLLGLLGLGLAYLHYLNLKAHWTTPQPVRDGTPAICSKVHPLPLSQALAPTDSAPLGVVAPTAPLRSWCHVLLIFKSLFSLSSLVFCLAQLPFCVTTLLIILNPSSDLGVLYWAPDSVETVSVLLSFNGMALAYLFMGEIWLDAASRFRLRIFIGTRLSKLLLQLPVLVLIVLTVLYVLSSSSPSAQMLVAMLGLGVCALIASGFLTVGASIMIPVIRERARQAEDTKRARQAEDKRKVPAPVVSNPSLGGGGSVMYAVNQEEPKERRSILRWLRRKREVPFRPLLTRIMEVDSTALEEPASQGYLNTTGTLPDSASPRNHMAPRTPRGQVQGGEEGSSMGRQVGDFAFVRAGGGQAKREDVEQQATGEQKAFQDTAPRTFDWLAWHVASTALQVGGASVLSLVAYLAAMVLLADPPHQSLSSPWRGVVGSMCAYAAFPLCHLYANLVCLCVISKEARDAIRPLRHAMSRLAALLSSLLCSLLCCGVSEEGFETSSGASRMDEQELA